MACELRKLDSPEEERELLLALLFFVQDSLPAKGIDMLPEFLKELANLLCSHDSLACEKARSGLYILFS